MGFILLCEIFVPIFLEELIFQFYNLIGWQLMFLHISLGSIGLVSTCCKREICHF